MAPPQAIPILGQMEDTPVQVSYLWIPGGCHICSRAARPDLNHELTRIVAPYWPPNVYLSLTRIMTPPQAIPILCQIRVYICSCLIYLWFPGGCHICPRSAGLTSIMVLGGDSNSGPVLVPRRLFESESNNGPSPGHSNLVSNEVHISVQVSYL